MICLNCIEECDIYKKTVRENIALYLEIQKILDDINSGNLRAKMEVLKKLYPTKDGFSTIMAPIAVFGEAYFAFYSSAKLALLGHYEISRPVLRTALENIFRYIRIVTDPQLAENYSNSEITDWVSLNGTNIKNHYKNRPSQWNLENELIEHSGKLSQFVHTNVTGKRGKLFTFKHDIEYDHKKFIDCILLLRETHEFCDTLVSYEVGYKSEKNLKETTQTDKTRTHKEETSSV